MASSYDGGGSNSMSSFRDGQEIVLIITGPISTKLVLSTVPVSVNMLILCESVVVDVVIVVAVG